MISAIYPVNVTGGVVDNKLNVQLESAQPFERSADQSPSTTTHKRDSVSVNALSSSADPDTQASIGFDVNSKR
jgi:hypothetical protein